MHKACLNFLLFGSNSAVPSELTHDLHLEYLSLVTNIGIKTGIIGLCAFNEDISLGFNLYRKPKGMLRHHI